MMQGKYICRPWVPVFSNSSGSDQISILYLGDKVDIFEIDGNWSRISDYFFDVRSDRENVKISKWVPSAALSDLKPEFQEVDFGPELMDSRISGLPRIGEWAHSVEDLFILRTRAVQFLKDGVCTSIVSGGKRKTGDYYLECEGENAYRRFNKDELP